MGALGWFVAGLVSPYVGWFLAALVHDYIYLPLWRGPRDRAWWKRREREEREEREGGRKP